MGKKSGRSSGVDAPKATAFVLKVPMHCRCDGCADKIRAAVKDLTLRCDGILSLDQSALATRGELAVVATADPERLRRRLRKATGKSVDLVFPKPPAARAAAGKDAAVQALLAALQQQAANAHYGHPLPAAGTWNALQPGGYGQAAAYPWPCVRQQQALLAALQQQQQQAANAHYGHPLPAAGTWNALQPGGYGQAAAYPWPCVRQQQAANAHYGHPLPAAGTWNALQPGGYGQAAYPWPCVLQQQAPPEPYFASYPAAAYPAASWGAYPHDGLGGAYGGWLGY